MERRVALFLTSAAILWAAAIFLAPLSPVLHVGGRVPEMVRMAGALLCHQRVLRLVEGDQAKPLRRDIDSRLSP